MQDIQELLTSNSLSRAPASEPVYPPWPKCKVDIETELITFLKTQMEDFDPDIVIVVERKGTAVLRCALEKSPDEKVVEWRNVLSSTAIENGDLKDLDGKRILVFDDMMRTGEHLTKLIRNLLAEGIIRSDLSNLRVAVFAVHQKMGNELGVDGQRVPYKWFYSGLADSGYRALRDRIIETLQAAGSLMLDTEHIEVLIRTKCSIDILAGLLSRRATVVPFSSGGRMNLTVFFGVSSEKALIKSLGDGGLRFQGVVTKCRVVERAPNCFALIPICYPAVPEDYDLGNVPSRYQSLFKESAFSSKHGRFQAAGLLASMVVLGWIVEDLAAGDEPEVTIESPRRSGDPGLDHLNVVLPGLDVSILESEMRNLLGLSQGGRRGGTQSWKAREEETGIYMVEEREFHHSGIRLVQEMRYLLDVRGAEKYLSDGHEDLHPFGLRTREIFEIGKGFGWEDPKTSALFDLLIDHGILVTHVEPRIDADRSLLVRTFEPDGEVVSQAVRDVSYAWGRGGYVA